MSWKNVKLVLVKGTCSLFLPIPFIASAPSPSTCLPECSEEGCFFTASRYKEFGHDSPLFMLFATASKECIDHRFCQCQADDLKCVISALWWRWWCWGGQRSYSSSRRLQPEGCVWASCQHSQETVLLELSIRGFKHNSQHGDDWLTWVKVKST